MTDVKNHALSLGDYVYRRLVKRLEGLTDDEYLWEPAPDMWTIRRQPVPGPWRNASSPSDAYQRDWGAIFDEDPPLTTIAWRMAEIFSCLAAERCATWLGLDPDTEPFADGLPPTADGAREMLDRAYATWRGYVARVDEQSLWEPLGPIAGQWAEDTRLGFVWHILDEFIHHSAEVALMRDLYRATRPQDPFVLACLQADEQAIATMRRDDPRIVDRTMESHPNLMLRAAATGRWDAVPLLIELGFPVDTGGRAAVHHAAADDRLDLVKLLVDQGADLDARDPVYNATPLEWAEYFNQMKTADYLRSLQGTRAT